MTPVKIDPWLFSIVCDPIGKSPLTVSGNWLLSDYGRRYPIVDGVYDLRALTTQAGSTDTNWKKGQDAYEVHSQKLIDHSSEDYAAQRDGVSEVYQAIPIVGRCLDVGGNDGRLRAFLSPGQEYVSIDPFIGIVKEPRNESFRRVYPFAEDPLNFLASLAEQLPFISKSFDTVHIRSAIDHFQSPELGLREAYRVLRADGILVVGLLVKGGRTGRDDLPTRSKEAFRTFLVGIGLNRFADHHIWHPTYLELCNLIESTGFRIDYTHWQRSERDRVCYIRAFKVLE